MAETIALPAAISGAGYAAGFAPSFRASFTATNAGDSAGSSFSSALRGAAREQRSSTSHGDDDRASAYAGATAVGTATPVPPQTQRQPTAGDGQADGAAGAGDDGGQGNNAALAALQGRALTLLAGPAGAAQPSAAAGAPANGGLPSTSGATLPASGHATPSAGSQEAQGAELADAATALADAGAGLAQALHGVQVQLAASANGGPVPQSGDPHEKSQKDKASATAAFAGMPVTRAAHQPAQAGWAPAHRPDSVTATTTPATTNAAGAPGATAAPPAAAQPRLNQPTGRPAGTGATGAWASTGTRQADGPGDSTPIRAIDQVADGLVMTVRQGKSEATLSLQPASLGAVKVQLSTGQDGLIIRLSAERDATGDLLRAHMGELREVLAGQQIAVSELHVLHNPPAPTAAGGQNAPHDGFAWQERPKANQQNANQGDGNTGSDQDSDEGAEPE